MDDNDNKDAFERRRCLIEHALDHVELTLFHWLLIAMSPKWIPRDCDLAEVVYHNATCDGMFLSNGFYVPDIDRMFVHRCDGDLFARQLVYYVDTHTAKAMVKERAEFDPTPLAEAELLSYRVLTDNGMFMWRTVMEALADESPPILTGEIVDGREVHHQPVPFGVAQCCIKCLNADGLHAGEGVVEKVGPWYSEFDGKLMPSGWRMICPHASRPAGFCKRVLP